MTREVTKRNWAKSNEKSQNTLLLQNTRFEKPISARERLVITLWYLATENVQNIDQPMTSRNAQ